MRAAIVLLLLSSQSHAGSKSPTPKILGWNADGTKLSYVAPPEEVGESDFGGTGTVTWGVILDGRSGLEERYFLSSTGEVPPAERRSSQKKEFQALTHGLKCDEGRGEVAIKGKGVKGSWDKSVFEFNYEGDEMAEEKKATFTMSVKSPSATWSVSSPNAAMGASLRGHIRSCFGPKRVAWIVERSSGMMRDPGDYAVVIGPLSGPRIQLVADKSILSAAAQKVGAALGAAGIVSVGSKASNEKTARATSVVYAAAGFEADAQKVAAAVPGGATVAKLDWKAAADIVVGIGATAMK